MKKLFLFLICAIIFIPSFAQTPSWVWAKDGNSNINGSGEGYIVATDKSENLYITGVYVDTIAFDSYVLHTGSNGGLYLVKYDLDGNVKWTKTSTGSIHGLYVATDDFGNSFLTGGFNHTAYLDTFSLIEATSGGGDLFLAKYDSLGTCLWAQGAGGSLGEGSNCVATDASGNAYITGFFESATFPIGAFTLFNQPGNNNFFLAKYDSFGKVLWAKSATGRSYAIGLSVATDVFANVYVTGYFRSDTFNIGSYTFFNAGSGFDDIFVAKYDSSGNLLWATAPGGTGRDRGVSIATDSSSNVYLTGYYTSSIMFDNYHLAINGQTAFLVKYNSSGNVIWAKNISPKAATFCLATYKSEKVYLTGAQVHHKCLLIL